MDKEKEEEFEPLLGKKMNWSNFNAVGYKYTTPPPALGLVRGFVLNGVFAGGIRGRDDVEADDVEAGFLPKNASAVLRFVA
jgi:hypothetical protein